MDLADELMHDLAELDDETSAYREDGMDGDTADGAEGEGGIDVPDGGMRPAEELDVDEVEGLDMHKVADVAKIARLSTNPSFQDCLQSVEAYRQKPPTDMSSSESPEYQLIVRANNYAVEVDNEVLLVHKFVKDHYAPRFEELEQFLPAPGDFCRAVLKIGNPEDLSGLQNRLQGIMQPAVIMVVTVTASTNTGRQLSSAEWAVVQKACEMCAFLEKAKLDILTYVESRMNQLAPNLSAIIGTRTATKLLGMAGGLQSLSRQPSCNMHLFGAQKKNAALGFATGAYSAHRKHVGFIYQSELVQSMPEEYRMKAQRTISAKCVLAVRMDVSQSHPDGSYGVKMLAELEKKLEKLQEPPPSKVIKALPKPAERSSKKRGGKRARKQKEAYAMTELRKLQNRVRFGEEEEEDGAYDETKGLGMIGSSSGKLRVAADSRSNMKMSQKQQKRLAALKNSASAGGSVSGLSSSLAFTPVQGMELVDPALQKRRLEAANESWFKNETPGSFSVLPGQGKKSKLIQ